TFAFQSQSILGGAWLGPTVEDAILELKQNSHRGVFLQPIGFLCDNVEVLYDIDIGFKQFAEKESMRLWRADLLNDSLLLVAALVGGCLVEAGPDSFLTEKPWAADLCRQIGLGDQLIGSNDTERKTYILVKGRLVAIPDGLMFMVPTKLLPTVFSPLFSLGTKLRMAREWFHPPHKADGDETVASLVERHYGAEMVDRLADPLLAGVYGGNASQLSVHAVLPRFPEVEASHGSLGRAMLAAREKAVQAG